MRPPCSSSSRRTCARRRPSAPQNTTAADCSSEQFAFFVDPPHLGRKIGKTAGRTVVEQEVTGDLELPAKLADEANLVGFHAI